MEYCFVILKCVHYDANFFYSCIYYDKRNYICIET